MSTEEVDNVGGVEAFFNNLLAGVASGLQYMAVEGYNALISAEMGVYDGITENPFSIVTNTSLKPYAKNEVAYDFGKLGVEVLEALIGGKTAELGASALGYMPALYVSGGPVVGVLATVADVAVTAGAVEMSLASFIRASQTLGELAEDTAASNKSGTKQPESYTITFKSGKISW